MVALQDEKCFFIQDTHVHAGQSPDEESTVSFRLIYEGELLSKQSSNGKNVTANRAGIRRQLHVQLRELWQTHQMLQTMARLPIQFFKGETPLGDETGLQSLARKYKRGEFHYVPLISSDFKLLCSLDVLFLRREAPGKTIQGGDIDNRIKTLFDGLKVPDLSDEMGDSPTEDEKPFFCLLSDDGLISEVKITTDRLLKPPTRIGGHAVNDIMLVMSVQINQDTLRLW